MQIQVLPFFVPHLIFFITVFGIERRGWGTFATVVIFFVLHPLFDQIIGRSQTVPQDRHHKLFSLAVWSFVPLLFLFIGVNLARFLSPELALYERVGLMLSTGITCGTFGFTVAHELIHRPRRWERGVGVLVLAGVTHMHFRLVHVYWHHRYVATHLDPSSAPKGQNLYMFWLRAVIGNLSAAWELETARLSRSGQRTLTPHNRCLQYLFLQFAVYIVLYSLGGILALVFFSLQSVIAVCLLETINYVEHYGLHRKELAKGAFEPMSDRHSWDSTHRLTNWFLFNLGFHSLHHMEPAMPYERLKPSNSAPLLPYGYSTMFLLSLIPPLWKRVMDTRLPT